jgi:rod shape-determining protein MreC
VGKVTQLRKTGNGLFQDAVVVPAVDVTRVEEVLVLTSWETRTSEIGPPVAAPGRKP